jgi:hypothetical protein
MTKPKQTFKPPSYDDRDVWIPDDEFIKELGIGRMSMHRYDRDPVMHALGWPPPMKIKERNYRSRRVTEAFKANMLKRAMAARRKLMEKVSEEAA